MRLLFICNLPYSVAVFGLMLLAATWIYYISYRKEYVGLLFFDLLPLSTVGEVTKCRQFKPLLLSITLVEAYLNFLKWFSFFILMGDPLIILIGSIIFLSIFSHVIRTSMSAVPFFAVILCNSLSAKCLLMT